MDYKKIKKILAVLLFIFNFKLYGEEISPPEIKEYITVPYPPYEEPKYVEINLIVDIDEKGNVIEAKIEGEEEEPFSSLAIEAIKRFKFIPAKKGGVPIKAKIAFTYTFIPPPITYFKYETKTSRQQKVKQKQPLLRQKMVQAPIIPVYEKTITEKRVTSPSSPKITLLKVEELNTIPGTGGDPLKSLYIMPGVARTPFDIGMFIIRGTAPEDTNIFLEGHPILLPFHFGGLKAILSFDLINSIEFFTGNFPKRFGRATGGIINIKLRSILEDKFSIKSNINLMDISFGVIAPIIQKKITIGAFIRRSYIDAILPIFLPETETFKLTLAPVYWDYQIIGEWKINLKEQLKFIIYGSDDRFELLFPSPISNDPALRGVVGEHLSFHGAQLHYSIKKGSFFEYKASIDIGGDKVNTEVGPFINVKTEGFHIGLRNELVIRVNPWFNLEGGLDNIFSIVENWLYAPPVPEPTENTTYYIDIKDVKLFTHTFRISELGAYLSFKLKPENYLELIPELRLDYYPVPKAISLQPLLSVNLLLTERLKLGGSIGYYSQQYQLWKTIPGYGDPELKYKSSIHYQILASYELIKDIIYFEIVGFFLWMDRVEKYGIGKSHGIETILALKPTSLPIYGWLSYTWSRSFRNYDIRIHKEMETYDFDQPHILNLVIGGILPWNIETGLRFRFATGNPVDKVIGAIYDSTRDIYIPYYSSEKERLPNFIQLDFRISKLFIISKVKLILSLDIQNVTNGLHAEAIIYSYNYKEKNYLRGLPIIPNLGLQIIY